MLRLPARDLALLLRVGVLLALVRLGLGLVPLLGLQTFLGRWSRSPAVAGPMPPDALERLAWAVDSAARYRLGTCLSRALVLQFLLSRGGVSTRLWLGVQRAGACGGSARRGLRAHAWIEHDGRALVGGPAPERYTPIGYLQAGEGWIRAPRS